MKWLWVLLLLMVAPGSVQAEPSLSGAYVTVIGQKVNQAHHPQSIRFFFGVQENGNYLRANFKFYVPEHLAKKSFSKSRCVLWVNNRQISGFGNYWINGETGRELWFPSLHKRDRVTLAIFWDKDHPSVEYAAAALESNRGTSTDLWMSYRAERIFQSRPVSDRAVYYRELSLDDVCSS